MKLTANLRKRKQDLLDKQLIQQKQLIERLEKGGVAPEQREELMSTVKSLQVRINVLLCVFGPVEKSVSQYPLLIMIP